MTGFLWPAQLVLICIPICQAEQKTCRNWWLTMSAPLPSTRATLFIIDIICILPLSVLAAAVGVRQLARQSACSIVHWSRKQLLCNDENWFGEPVCMRAPIYIAIILTIIANSVVTNVNITYHLHMNSHHTSACRLPRCNEISLQGTVAAPTSYLCQPSAEKWNACATIQRIIQRLGLVSAAASGTKSRRDC